MCVEKKKEKGRGKKGFCFISSFSFFLPPFFFSLFCHPFIFIFFELSQLSYLVLASIHFIQLKLSSIDSFFSFSFFVSFKNLVIIITYPSSLFFFTFHPQHSKQTNNKQNNNKWNLN